MAESKIVFGLTEEGKLVASPGSLLDALEFVDGSWNPVSGSMGDLLTANLVSDIEASRRSSGIMPDFSK